MSRQQISIIGPIGSFKVGNQEINGIPLKNVVASVSALPADTTELQVNVASGGGVKEVGDSIYGFLMSLKPKMKIIMNQVGDIGSIATKFWFAGDERIGLEGLNPETGKPFEFFVHNPWIRVQGDSQVLQAALDTVKIEEADLADFYVKQTGITPEGIQPLMNAQTGFDASTALKMKFCTSVRQALNTAAYNMEKVEQEKLGGLLEQLKSFFTSKPAAAAPSSAPAPAPAAAAPPATAPADLASLTGKKVQVDGADAPDGVYTIKGGAVVSATALAAAPAPAPAPTVDAALAAKIDEVLKLIKPEQTEAEKLEAIVSAKVKEAEEKIRAEFKTNHKPAYKPVILDFKNLKESPVQARQRELRERQAAK